MSPPVQPKDNTPGPRPHLGIHFKCCNVYSRIYLTRDERAFAGNCPKCAAPIRIPVGESGSNSKFWEVG